MPFRIIKGKFYVKGFQPDGDSIKFVANDKKNWRDLKGKRISLLHNRFAQLRLEGIDALETHYYHKQQPTKWAWKATDFLLGNTGITDFEWGSKHVKITKAKDGVPGYILCRQIGNYRRPISFAFSGNPPQKDGSEVFLDKNMIKRSLNYKLMKAGLVYPTYYKALFYDLREELTKAVKQARTQKKGLWKDDKSHNARVSGLDSIENDIVIFPKIFRRLIDLYLAENKIQLARFKKYLENNPEEILIVDKGHMTNFDDVVEITNTRIKLLEKPENLVFIPK